MKRLEAEIGEGAVGAAAGNENLLEFEEMEEEQPKQKQKPAEPVQNDTLI